MTTSGGGHRDAVWSGDPHKAARRKKVVRRLPPLLTAVIRVIHATLRYRLDVSPAARRLFRSGRPFILAFWHGRMVILSQLFRMQFPPPVHLWVLISHHWDGEIIARTVYPFGVRGIRGSSTRGGREAYAEMVARIRAGDCVGITPDGPKGPRYRVVQTGILRLARETGVPVVPVSWSARPRVSMRSWDRFQIPLPWARVDARYGDPMVLDPGEGMEVQRRRLETRMNRLNHETAARVREAAEWAPWIGAYRMGHGLLRLRRSLGFFRRDGSQSKEIGPLPVGSPATGSYTGAGTGAPVWLHTDCVAGMAAAIPLVQRLRSVYPALGLWVSASCGAAVEMARGSIDGGVFLRSFTGGGRWTGEGLRQVRPRLFVLVGTKLFPDLLLRLGAEGVPVALLNGRVSEADCSRALRFRTLYRAVLASTLVFGTQTRRDAFRIIRMGADPRRVHVTGQDPRACESSSSGGRGGEDAGRVAAVRLEEAGRIAELLEGWLDRD